MLAQMAPSGLSETPATPGDIRDRQEFENFRVFPYSCFFVVCQEPARVFGNFEASIMHGSRTLDTKNPTMFVMHFHDFVTVDPPNKIMKIQTFPKSLKTRIPGTMPK